MLDGLLAPLDAACCARRRGGALDRRRRACGSSESRRRPCGSGDSRGHPGCCWPGDGWSRAGHRRGTGHGRCGARHRRRRPGHRCRSGRGRGRSGLSAGRLGCCVAEGHGHYRQGSRACYETNTESEHFSNSTPPLEGMRRPSICSTSALNLRENLHHTSMRATPFGVSFTPPAGRRNKSAPHGESRCRNSRRAH
jgi:hypothetical protein